MHAFTDLGFCNWLDFVTEIRPIALLDSSRILDQSQAAFLVDRSLEAALLSCSSLLSCYKS